MWAITGLKCAVDHKSGFWKQWKTNVCGELFLFGCSFSHDQVLNEWLVTQLEGPLHGMVDR